MPPVTKPSTDRYDYIIVGGGSGGSGSSVRFSRSRARKSCTFCGVWDDLLTYASFCGRWLLTETCCVVWQEGRCGREHWCARRVLCQSWYVVSIVLY